jgi:hypothetical protein
MLGLRYEIVLVWRRELRNSHGRRVHRPDNSGLHAELTAINATSVTPVYV